MIIVIGTQGCRPCERLKNALRTAGIDFVYYDESEPRAVVLLKRYDAEGGPFPAVFKDDRMLPPMTKGEYLRSLRGF